MFTNYIWGTDNLLMIVLYNKMKVFCKKLQEKSIRMHNIEIRYSIGAAPGRLPRAGKDAEDF